MSAAALLVSLRQLGYEAVRCPDSHVRITTQVICEHHAVVPPHSPIPILTLSGITRSVARHRGLSVEESLRLLGL